jgi:ADP-heptose:LPS heptosyltransferase
MKILVLRFSSIGDIVLTSPVVRVLYKQIPNVEIHFATKNAFEQTLCFSPYIHKVKLLENGNWNKFVNNLKEEKYDVIVDLHNNLRTRRLSFVLGVKKVYRFKKHNVAKWLAVKFKNIKVLPQVHIVDRYINTIEKLGAQNDYMGLDYFTGNTKLPESLNFLSQTKFLAVVLGGQYFTKRAPVNKLVELVKDSSYPLVLLGGKEDKAEGEKLENLLVERNVINAIGLLSLNQSALVLKFSHKVISNDTGLMHIAAAFNKPILSLWGNTIPEFGMYPYYPKNSDAEKHSLVLQVKHLDCRPCSKIGFDSCPQGHFNCMNNIEFKNVTL